MHNNNSSNLLLLGDDNGSGLGFGFGVGEVVNTHTIAPGRRLQVRYPSGGPFFFCTQQKFIILPYTHSIQYIGYKYLYIYVTCVGIGIRLYRSGFRVLLICRDLQWIKILYFCVFPTRLQFSVSQSLQSDYDSHVFFTLYLFQRIYIYTPKIFGEKTDADASGLRSSQKSTKHIIGFIRSKFLTLITPKKSCYATLDREKDSGKNSEFFPSPLSKLELVGLNVIISHGFWSSTADVAIVSVSSEDTTAIKKSVGVSIEI